MSWRNQDNHKAETSAVKRALKNAGYRVKRVYHGKGTAWSWLHVDILIPSKLHSVVVEDRRVEQMTRTQRVERREYLPCVGNCPACEWEREQTRRVYALIRDVTGRSGDYDGNTIVQLVEEEQKVGA